MAIKVDYVLRETGNNLVRNVTLTLASILTVVVSLTLFGSAWLLQQGVENANERFKGGIEFIVYLKPDSTAEQRASVAKDLDDNPEVKKFNFVDQDETYREFKQLFKDSPQLIDTVSPDIAREDIGLLMAGATPHPAPGAATGPAAGSGTSEEVHA